jgi:hypothetical protein
MLFSPCAQRIAYYAIMQKSAVVALALLAGSPADAFVLPASAIARVHIAGVPGRSPVPGLAPFDYPPWADVGNMAELGMLFLACAPRSSPHKNHRYLTHYICPASVGGAYNVETPDVSKFNKACTAVTEYCEEGLVLMREQKKLVDAEVAAKGLPTGPSP